MFLLTSAQAHQYSTMENQESTKLIVDPPKESTSSTLTVPKEGSLVEKKEKSRSRSSSPVTLPTQLILKLKSQMGRVKVLKTMRSKLPIHAHSTSVEELEFTLAQVEELHQKFCTEHEYFESAWPARCVDHDYFESEVAAQEAELVWDIKLRVNRLREDVEMLNSSRPSLKGSSSSRAGKLPELTLPTFSGIYTEWPGFSELFSSLIIKDTQLAEIDKLHYLRSSLSGEPSRQVNAHPLTGSSFQTCWEYLERRYSNKRVLIEEQLVKLLNLTPVSTRSAATLNSLVASIHEVHKSITALGAAEDMYNCILVHQATNCLDKTTREAWETSVGSSNDYPRYEQLAAFIEDKATALERLEAAEHLKTSKSAQPSSTSTSRSLPRKGSAHSASQQKVSAQRSPYAYPCDHCKEDHYIVTCAKFRALSVPDRRSVITRNKLCRNCCGRHRTEDCKSTQRCKTCAQPHHTMLHLPKAPASAMQAAQTSSKAEETPTDQAH